MKDSASNKRRKLSHNDTTPGSQSVARSLAEDDSESVEEENLPNSCIAKIKRNDRSVQGHEEDGYNVYAGGLHKSNMFKLQVDAMLEQVQPNYEKRASGIDNALRALKDAIELSEDREPLSISDATKLLYKSFRITVPFPDPKLDKNAAYKLLYRSPSNINVVGSYLLKTMAKSESPSVDMVVTMPSSIFQEKDYLNFRYFNKRAYYLACIAAGLQSSVQDQFDFRFENLNGNQLHPVLIASPKSGKKSTFEVQIILAAPKAYFPEAKLRPDRISIRQVKDVEASASTLKATPFYNASLQSDCNVEDYLRLLHSASELSTGFKDACILGRIWLKQRGFCSKIIEGGFGHFEWAVLTALLLRGGSLKGQSVLAAGYSSYQMFKAVIQFLSSSDMVIKPLLYEASNIQVPKSNSPMLYDGPRGQNILYKMSTWSYNLLQYEAKTSLDMLNDPTFDQFESTFITRTDQILQRFDCVIQVPLPTQDSLSSPVRYITPMSDFSNRLYDTLKEGLSDRVTLINIIEPRVPSWSLKNAGPTIAERQLVTVAVNFNPSNIGRLIEHGPAAEEKSKAAKFRKFWGEKAELRRFRDGSILECLAWSSGSSYSMFEEIVKYLIGRHFDVETSKRLTFVGQNFEEMINAPGTDAKYFEALRQAFQSFETSIRELEGLPLHLRQLSAVNPQLRYASVKPPICSSGKPLKDPADVLIQFEGSGRWPDDVVAIQRTKIAFLLKIGSLLQDVDGTLTTRLGLENDDQPLQNCAFLDVIYQSGVVFRLRIQNDREQTLLGRQIKDKSTDQRSREQAVRALSQYKFTCLQLPLHSQSIAIHCTRFPLLSPTIRLAKMWFSRHMLSRHASEELIELLAVRVFLQPYPWRAPSSAMSGFLRVLLFLSRWDWRIEPLIVDFSGAMTGDQATSIQTQLEAWRKIDPGMNRTVVIAASNHDVTGTAFTQGGPSKVAAARMTSIARSACKLIKEQGFNLDPRALFATSTNDFDFVVKLNPEHTRSTKRKETQNDFKNLQVQSRANHEAVGYDPIECFIETLENLYPTSIILFHNDVTPSVIAGLWNLQTTSSRPFKVNLPYASKPTFDRDSENGDVELDKAAILSEIARIGGDMVSTIDVR